MRWRFSWIICFIFLSLNSTLALNYQRFDFVNSQSQPINDIAVKGFFCKETACSSVYVGDMWNGQVYYTQSDVPLNSVVVSTPVTRELPANSKACIMRFLSLSYLPEHRILTPGSQSISVDHESAKQG
jgi:hypothetical protein